MNTTTEQPETVTRVIDLEIASPDALDVGMHDCIRAAAYHSDPCPRPSLSSSIAAELVAGSPARARVRHPRLRHSPADTEDEETSAMSFGSAVHDLLLGCGAGLAVWPGDTWRGNDAKQHKLLAHATGKTAIKQADFDRAANVANAVRDQLIALGLGYIFEEGKSEQVAIWKHGEHYMRAMFDRWIPARGEIWDIKTTGKSAHPEQIARTVASMNYDLRSEFYLMGAEAITGLPSKRGGLGYLFLFVETSPPYCVTPCFLDESFRERGRRRANEAIATWARCMDSGIWPGYVDGPVEIAAPGWVDYEIEDSEIAPSGERIL